MASIRLDNVVKRFPNGHVAVHPATLLVADGEFLVLVGPSGCGKSTTLRMIAGLEDVTEGKIFVGERCVNDVPPGKRDMAMVFQNYALYPHMTVRDNLAFGLRMRRLARAEIRQRVDEAASVLSIQSLLDRRPSELSGGQRQRVAVGRAIVRQPSAFLFDEPLSNLDARLRVQMRRELALLHNRLRTTTVYVTHDQVEAMTLGQRIAVMHEGVIQQVASPAELYDRPANRFVATFIGSPAMNLLAGSLSVESGQVVFQCPSVRYVLENAPATANPGEPVLLGFRPEQLTQDARDPVLGTANVDLVEQPGGETLVYFRLGTQAGVARLASSANARNIRPTQQLTLHLPASNWYLFSAAEPGLLLARGAGDQATMTSGT